MSKLKVGDKVVLNDVGLEQIFGTTVGLRYMKTLGMSITHIDEESMTFIEGAYEVEVDNPDITQYMISDLCFDKEKEDGH